MNSTEVDAETPENDASDAAGAEGEAEKKAPLTLEVQVTEPSTCQRHVTVTISRPDIDRYFSKAFDELLPKAEIPGFRPGRAPRKLIESRFRDQVKDQVKGSLLMDSMAQISDTHQFTAISEPDFKLDAIVLPEVGPLTFEFDLEVRPNFEVPEWKGLTLKRPIHEYSDEAVERQLARVLERYGDKAPVAGPALDDDFVTVRALFYVNDQHLSTHPQLELRVRPHLSFRDARIELGRELLIGTNVGDRREGQVMLAPGIDSPFAGQPGRVEIEVLEIKRITLPLLNRQFLLELGGFESAEELRGFLRQELEKQFAYHQQQQMRQQITSILTANANWDLPPDLLHRQAKREVDRTVLELRSNGFSDEQIRSHSNQLRQNSLASTKTALKEHFILERIAELENIDAAPQDYNEQVRLIAQQGDESERRVRARLEKRGQMDTLRNQIVERKVIDLITASASITEVPFDPPAQTEFAADVAITLVAEENEIPEAKFGESGGDTLKPAEPTR